MEKVYLNARFGDLWVKVSVSFFHNIWTLEIEIKHGMGTIIPIRH